MRAITTGLLASSDEAATRLKPTLRTGGAIVVAEVRPPCAAPTDAAVRRLLEANPEIVLIDEDDAGPLLASLEVLHRALPAAWKLVTSAVTDPHTIIEAMRRGAREFLTKPVADEKLVGALARHREEKKSQEAPAAVRGKLFVIASAKEGSGATTVAINLAAAAAELPGTRVGLIDLGHPLGDLAAYLNLKPRFTVSDALEAASRLDAVLLDSFAVRSHRMSVLAGPQVLSPEGPASHAALGQLLDVAAEAYTHAFCDLAWPFNREHLHAVKSAGARIVLVVRPELGSVWRTHRLLRYLADFDLASTVQLVLNGHNAADAIAESDVQRALDQAVDWTISENRQGAIEAINAGKPLILAGNSRQSGEFRSLALRITGIAAQDKKRSFLGLFPRLTSTEGAVNG